MKKNKKNKKVYFREKNDGEDRYDYYTAKLRHIILTPKYLKFLLK